MPQGQGDCHVLSEREGAGGCALNSAATLAAMGLPVSLGGNYIGEDTSGGEIRSYLSGLGVDERIVASPRLKTPVCQVLVDRSSGRRDFILSHSTIHEHAPELLAGYADECAVGRFSHVFLQCYSQDLARSFLDRLATRLAGAKRDFWLMTQDLPPDSPLVPEFDAIQISHPESEPWDASHADALAAPYFRGNVSTLFITAGPRGVALCERGVPARLFPSAVPSQVLDTTGCGDAFRAGLMAGLYRELSLADSVAFGSLVGSRKAELLGSHFTDGARALLSTAF